MDHIKYLLTIFLEEDDSFFKYLSEQSDEVAMTDIVDITKCLNFLLMILIKSKDKLESVGYYYEPLSEEMNSFVNFSDMKSFRVLFNKVPTSFSKSVINVNKGYLSDFVVSMLRYKKCFKDEVPVPTTYIDPRIDKTFLNMLSILHKNEKTPKELGDVTK
ncbi:virion protein [Tanapox virus]|uniref:Virion protein n=2 Tax=Tanapox virus TaxID=99000 RepID=A7XCI8_9POXV|nr:65R protein [Yaba-like disease virus]ABQ43540.1 virion protein [Tanapox virus]ABQ43695.1 virion protein [Tanapox virus]CAC21303.1 65R protein [Yaba-like disease virus]